ncbi:MAG: adenylyltransferase/cytidyltransferase family protein [Candidatus Thermoplasmatota archaeon]|nr:adenylyltransferase/cytidyltransferase family protein [Candidatus Thermoplasmatota archaeon]
MVRVMASGVFDIIHPGHIFYLQKAKELGDELFVVIANDKTTERKKRKPIMHQEERALVVSALKPVDGVVIGKETGDIFDTVKEIKPDIIALGFDQEFDEKLLERDAKEHKLDMRVVRLPKMNGGTDATRKIIAKILEAFNDRERANP